MTQKQRDKIGDLLLDIAKYIITVIVLATWFRGADEWIWYMYLPAILTAIIAIYTAIVLFKDKNNKKIKKNRR